jgi:hypothetical protein
VISGSANLVVNTGAVVSGDNLAVRWAQTANPGPTDFFAFDNVTLSAAAIAPPVPVPTLGATGAAILMLMLLLSGMFLRRT